MDTVLKFRDYTDMGMCINIINIEMVKLSHCGYCGAKIETKQK